MATRTEQIRRWRTGLTRRRLMVMGLLTTLVTFRKNVLKKPKKRRPIIWIGHI